jgi:hypothetical protein
MSLSAVRAHELNARVEERNDHHALYDRRRSALLWLLGLVSAYTMGGFIHVLLVIAVVAILVRVISGRNLV